MEHKIVGVLPGLALTLTIALSFTAAGQRAEEDPRWDEEVDRNENVKSTDLERDLKAMWRTVPVSGEQWDPSGAHMRRGHVCVEEV